VRAVGVAVVAISFMPIPSAGCPPGYSPTATVVMWPAVGYPSLSSRQPPGSGW
jgi:hypothetical protein